MSFEDKIRNDLRGTTDEQDLPIPDAVRRRIDETLASLVGDSAIKHGTGQVDDKQNQNIVEVPSRRKAVFSLRRTRRLALAITFLLLSTSIWIASNPQTVDSMKPYLSSIFGWIGDEGVKQNLQLQQSGELPILTEVKNNGYILRIHEAFYDGLQVSFTYTFRKEQGEIPTGDYVIPDFQLTPSAKSVLGYTYKFDHGGLYDGYEAGVVKYFLQKKLPETFTLAINVPKFGVQHSDGRPYTVIQGDWSFELPITGVDHTHTVKWDNPLRAEHENHSFEVVRLRMSDTAAEWHLKLQIPFMRKQAMFEQGEYVHFRIQDEKGKELEGTGEWSTSHHTERPPTPDSAYIEDAWLYTPPVPSGSTITVIPMIRTMATVNGEPEWKETPLEGLTMQVPVQ
ncbi:hypothetical protein DFQ01_105236 [Paenibacillus cellulosilyticus]|uniref:DUF4179 domain-containing protein n=1 Tax=Paenibacillus cellulosilyticus TaxID=375489 RepID=A0A2V2YVK3_9BACL|nr:DUF4179 domain-containing protein [Paenibacillus cellulosilyticus]PWW05252.1 hypothetical protein DFQ01_105236 [Paenibacillus cellulosilyticus]QKS43576.1 hypothetical protein HUB94_03320 [Paenibacillus cellulosilyticus]